MNILFFSSSIKISVYVPKSRRHRIQNKWQKMVFYSAKKENETKQQEEKRLMTLRWTKRREKYGKKEIKCETRRMEHVETKMFTRERIISFFPSSSLSASTAFWLDVGWKCEAEYTYDEREHKREWTKWRDDYIFCVLSKLSHALRKCSNSRQRKRIKYSFSVSFLAIRFHIRFMFCLLSHVKFVFASRSSIQLTFQVTIFFMRTRFLSFWISCDHRMVFI